MNDWHDFLEVLLIIIVMLWCIAALPIGRATMRGDLLKEGFRVAHEDTLLTGEGRWTIEVYRDGWVAVER